MRNRHVPPGFWRGVNLNQNAVHLECFIDEVAHAAGQDPLAFRQRLLAGSPKHLAVFNAVAARAGWGQPAAKGWYEVETIVLPSGGFWGRRGRADHRGSCAGGAERHLRGRRQAHPRSAPGQAQLEEA